MIPDITDIMDVDDFHKECDEILVYLQKRKLTAHQALFICGFMVTNISSDILSESDIKAFYDKSKDISLTIKNKETPHEIYFN